MGQRAHQGTATPRGVGASNGTSRQAPFDRWFRYPAGFSAHTVDVLISQHPCAHPVVIDPFCGAGTVGSRSVARGLTFVGVEAHPEIAELAGLKLTTSPPRPEDIVLAAKSVVNNSGPRPSGGETELVQRCFAPRTLQQLVGLREQVKTTDPDIAPYLKWALLASLRDTANVKVGWPYLRPDQPRTPPYRDPAARFIARADWMAEDLRSLHAPEATVVIHGDSSRASTWKTLADNAIKGGLCITSPPYLNNFDYADATRLETYFWGRNRTWKSLCDDVRADMLVATTQQTSTGAAELAITQLASEFGDVADDVLPLQAALADQRRARSRGKEYDRVLPAYMLGIARVLQNLLAHLHSGAWSGWVVGDSAPYGVYVDTPQLILRAARSLGYEKVSTTVLRERGQRWSGNTQRHSVALNERVVWMRVP
ncbi:hypothetical protein A5669_27250 [Mycolicibacterium fortuitum]|uniref:hypothetical protein n=1 Tax=Mycolicibacterium fortuitum TaxID=1766 RepID=UPI0007EA563D|nr:hypothetical protein [Mycolicibacterium fortuitum]OBG51053.1 hypothetical protein A5669_27250 [Mycolicibacterium fortuitum]